MKPAPVIGEVERKAGRKLGVTPDKVDEAARRRWQGRTLTAERDRRYANYVRGAMTRDPDDPETAQRRPARLGAITRDLIRELRPLVRAEAQRKSRRPYR
jgi:hypothetical protein